MAGERREPTGSWLDGDAFARRRPRGASLGLPADGPGSLATPGIRIAAFLLDSIVANLLAGLPYLFGVHYGPGDRGYAVFAAFLLQEWLLVAATGATIGKHLARIQVTRVGGGRLGTGWALLRAVLLGFLIPAVVWDADGRGLHDRAAGSITVRTGGRVVPPDAGPAPAAAARVAPAPKPAARPKPKKARKQRR